VRAFWLSAAAGMGGFDVRNMDFAPR